jgi:hypothetical protein
MDALPEGQMQVSLWMREGAFDFSVDIFYYWAFGSNEKNSCSLPMKLGCFLMKYGTLR